MRCIKLLSALSLVVSAPCVLSGQNPAPASPPPAPRREAAPMPAERRMEVRSMVMAKAGMRPMMMRDGGGMHGMGMNVAEMFLAHTGDLQLSDAQVTKLAAIARRSEARQKATQARMDSSMKSMHERVEVSRDGNGNGAPRAMMMMRMPMPSEADRKAQHEDDREAFSVPTPDQLATAWEMMRGHHER